MDTTLFNYSNVYEKVLNEVDDAIFLEIGIWMGASVVWLAEEIKRRQKNIKIFAVDTWEGTPNISYFMNNQLVKEGKLYESFLSNIEPFKDIITPIKMTSVDASSLFKNSSLDFVFIDGSHDYESVKQDIQVWLPKIKNNGYIGGHDYDNAPDVYRAVNETFDSVEVFNHGWASWLRKITNNTVEK